MCKVNLNKELNGIELSFDSKPDKATLDSIKAQGFRWNGRKMVWYAKQTADRLTFAESLGEIEQTKTAPKAAESINLDNLGSDPVVSYEYSKAIRDAFKARGVKGCTVRMKWSGYTPAVRVTVKATAEDLASIEEAAERFSFGKFAGEILNKPNGLYVGGRWLYSNEFEAMTEDEKEAAYYTYLTQEIKNTNSFTLRYFWSDRKNYWNLSTAFFNKLSAVWEIANQWNYDNSDSMTDYFDIGYFLDIDIKTPDDLELRATMTEEERTAYEEEQREEEEERARQAAEYEAKRIEDEKRAEERRKADEAAEELIYNNIIVEDLEESEQLYITDCVGGVGKEADYNELLESIRDYKEDCLIDRKVIFTSEEAYNEFIKRFLYDYIFLAGKGGTGSNDVRLGAVKHIYDLNEDQRQSVKWFCCHCVGIYFDDCLKLIVNPEGHNYARYVYLPTETSEEQQAAEVTKAQEQESLLKDAFYFPAPITEQAAQLHEGQEITIYQCDGWILNSIEAGRGIVTGFYMGEYAQYKGLWIELLNGRKASKVFVRDSKPCLIYEGIKGKLPAEVTSRRISANMVEMLNYNELLPNTYNYYLGMGEAPIIDTFKR